MNDNLDFEAAFAKKIQKDTLKEFAEALIEEFVVSAENQEFEWTAKILRNVCPAKVNKIRKRLERNIENEYSK